MAIRRSTALREAIATQMPYSVAMGNGRIKYYTGAQPASADTAPSGTLLCTFTKSGGTYTGETRATAVIVFSSDTGTPAVSVLKAGGSISLISGTVTSSDGTIATLCDELAADINATQQIPFFEAASNGTDTVTITAPVGMGTNANGLTLTVTAADVTATVNGGDGSTFGATVSAGSQTVGVDAANGCNFAYPDSSGVLSKESTVWQGTAVATGTVGWARWEFDPDDDQSTGTTYRRMDFTVGISGQDLIVGSTTITSTNTYSIDSGTFTVPAS